VKKNTYIYEIFVFFVIFESKSGIEYSIYKEKHIHPKRGPFFVALTSFEI